MTPDLDRSEIARVHDIIGPYVRQTPVLRASGGDVGLEPFPLLVEPGGAVAFAALLSGRYLPAHDEHVVVVLCGANTER
jgi:threonine dehydratase